VTPAPNVSTSSATSASAPPDELRERFRGTTVAALARDAAALRPNRNGDPVLYATKLAMQTLGRRVVDIDADCARLHGELADLVKATAPSLLDLLGVGVRTAALLLVAAGDNAERIGSEAAFAHLCGVAPIHASSGKTVRHRLNRGGNRQANHALWRIVFTRMGSDPRTRAYVERRLGEGRSKPEIMRVLKRYVAREVYRHLPAA
jgi:transposase